ncbi:penicillin-binding protein 1A [Oceanicella actignis]|nr:penicillin-binding protein 1A [Oceanicella actignis]
MRCAARARIGRAAPDDGKDAERMIRILATLFSLASIAGIAGLGAFAGLIWHFSRDLPDHEQLAAYQPPTLSRVYDKDGRLIAEYLTERRIFAPIDEIPDIVKQAFISAEDKHFYEHAGFDPIGILAAVRDYLAGGRLRGASTITQQVMKNFLLSNERSGERKLKEIILAVRLERTLSKDQILELYLNEIYLGARAYGVAAAADAYFGKPLEELTIAEAAYLAALPKAPSTLHPVRNRERAVARRNYVIGQMLENGYIDEEQANAAMRAPLLTVLDGGLPDRLPRPPAPDHFTEEVRRQLTAVLGEEEVALGGLTVRATVDPQMQRAAARALRRRLESWDRERDGWRGPLARLSEEQMADEAAWRAALAELREIPRDIEGWRPAVVLEVGAKSVRIGIEGVEEDADGHFIPFSDMTWARPRGKDGRLGAAPRRPSDVLARGDVILTTDLRDEKGAFLRWSLRQIPLLEGAFMAMDPRTGRVLAMQGGFSYQTSVFNRATQARRQPGSAFKPFVYAAALDNGYTPSTVIMDAPIVVDDGTGELWKPQNSSRKFYGPSPMRLGIEQSRNVMTVRLAQDLGMDKVAEYAERFGVYDSMPPLLSYALGAGETTLYRLVAAYAMFANGGLRVEPTLVDRVQDRRGVTVLRHDRRVCVGCDAPWRPDLPDPWLKDPARRVMDGVTAYQLTSMMQGVTTRGTARQLAALGFPVAGKTGTTNDARDAWFIGFTPNLVAGCFIGYDTPRPMGKGAYGGTLCAPVFQEFMEAAMRDRPKLDFKPPRDAVLVKIDRHTGVRLPDEAEGPEVVVEAFRSDQVPQIGAFTGGAVVGEGVFGFTPDGGDLPMRAEEDAPAPPPSGAPGSAAPGAGQDARPAPPRPAAGFGSGGLY